MMLKKYIFALPWSSWTPTQNIEVTERLIYWGEIKEGTGSAWLPFSSVYDADLGNAERQTVLLMLWVFCVISQG